MYRRTEPGKKWIRVDHSTVLDRMTDNSRKRELYDSEVYCREAMADCLELWPVEPLAHLSRLTAAILKPEAVAGRMLEVSLAFFRRNGFRVVAAQTLRIDRLMLRELWRYRFNVATPERLLVMDLLMSAGPSLFLVLDDSREAGATAAARLKSLKGPSTPSSREPHQLRFVLGVRSHLINYLHAPDEVADLVRELAILFDRSDRRRLLKRAAECQDRTHDAETLAADLYRTCPAHDLSYQRSLDRLEAASRAGAFPPDRSHAVSSLMEGIRSNQSRDWRTLFALLDEMGARIDAWDRIVVLAELIDMSLPGRAPLL